MVKSANAIFHVGGPKCGSSSLQMALSREPVFCSTDGKARYEYVCLDHTETLFRQRVLQRAAKESAHQYMCSFWRGRWASDTAFLAGLKRQLGSITADGTNVIFSSEGWVGAAPEFAKHDILPRMGLNAKVILFVRPQIPWLNSAWWQWGAWSNKSFERWLHEMKPMALWEHHADAWRRVPGVHSVEVYAATRDVVATFFQQLGARPPAHENSNRSLDADVLRFLQRHPDLRPGEHASQIDFVLEKRLPSGAKGVPWVLSETLTAELIEYFRRDNETLLASLPEAERRAIESDPLWWDATAFRGRAYSSPEAQRTKTDGDSLTLRAIQAVIALDERVRMLEAAQVERPVRPKPPLRYTLRKNISLNGIRRLIKPPPQTVA